MCRRDKIGDVIEIGLTADELVGSLLALSADEQVCILDSCGVGHLGSHLLIAGVRPVETLELSDADATLSLLAEKLAGELAAVFSLSYDFGLKLQGLERRERPGEGVAEPDIFAAFFDCLAVHDYRTGKSFLTGDERRFSEIESSLDGSRFNPAEGDFVSTAKSNFTKTEYIAAVEAIREHIRRGDTYQANLTQQFRVKLPGDLAAEDVFWRLRKEHPAPFASFLKRQGSIVVSASPERFFRVSRDNNDIQPSAPADSTHRNAVRRITSSPIKGTRPRGRTAAEDESLRTELLTSEKDRAENTMIVDLMRNDLGRVCKFGSVTVEKLCDLEEHPTLFHLVSTVSGELKDGTSFADIVRAVFPCGSITGAPKMSTMRIIDSIEPAARGLSMGAIGLYLPAGSEHPQLDFNLDPGIRTSETVFDLSVAIRTMVIRDGEDVFNVGGGIVIDSDPEKEYEESLLKAKALLAALGVI